MSDDEGEKLPQMQIRGSKASTLRVKSSALARFESFLATTRGSVC